MKIRLQETDPPQLSVLLHCQNESRHLKDLMTRWLETLRGAVENFEILALNAGSNDGTGRLLDSLRKNNKEIRVLHQLRIGPSQSFRRGLDLARGEFVGQARANGQYNPRDLIRMWEARKDHELVIGVRTHRLDSLPRRALAHGLRRTIHYGFGVTISDANIPFRLFRRETILPLIQRLPEGLEGLDITLAILAKSAFPDRVLEIKVPFRGALQHRPDTPLVSAYRQGGRIMVELLQLKLSLKRLLPGDPREGSN